MKALKILLILLSILLISGFYYSGDNVNIFVNCYTDDGSDDVGCTSTDAYCLGPTDDYSTKTTLTLAELDETNAPGLWNGTYSPASSGTHTCIARLTNSNSTVQSDNKIFSVRPDVLATQTNTTAIITQGDAAWTTSTATSTLTASQVWSESGRALTTPADYKADISTLATTANLDAHVAGLSKGMDDNRTKLATDHGAGSWEAATGFSTPANINALSEDMAANITDLESHGDSNWATATGFQTETDAATRDTNANLTRTQIIEVGGTDWITADVSSLATSTEVTAINTTLESNVIPEIQAINTTLKDNVITLINALNDITAADVWAYATRTITSLLVGDQYIASQQNITDTNTTISPEDIWIYSYRNITTLNEIDTMITTQASTDNQTRTLIVSLINGLNDIGNETIGLIYDRVYDTTNGLTAIKNYLVNTILVALDLKPSTTQVDLIINQSRGIDNKTRQQILTEMVAGQFNQSDRDMLEETNETTYNIERYSY